MKKAKVILTALSAVAAVGGALGFKVYKVNGKLFCTTSPKSACITTINYAPTIAPLGTLMYCAEKNFGIDGCKQVFSLVRVTIND